MGAIAELRSDLRGPIMDRVLTRWGIACVNAFTQAFRDQGIGRHKWPARARLSIPAIAEDLARGSHIQRAWFETRPAGIGPGGERPQIDWRRIGPSAIEVGSRERYASEMQRGTTKTVRITETIKRNAMIAVKRDRRLTPKDRRKLAWMANRKSVTVRIPPRPFIVMTEQLRRLLGRILLEEVRRG